MKVRREKTLANGFGLAAVLFIAQLAVLGCSSSKAYEDQDNWLVRENARPHYFAPYDIFYLAPQNYSGQGQYPYEAHGKAMTETVDQFGVHTRVFAPLYHDAEDVAAAYFHYLDHYHGNGLPWPLNEDDRPFVFVGEGVGAQLLSEFERSRPWRLRRKGFLGGWYSPDTTNGFITATMVKDVDAVVKSELYRRGWNRDVK